MSTRFATHMRTTPDGKQLMVACGESVAPCTFVVTTNSTFLDGWFYSTALAKAPLPPMIKRQDP